MSGNENLKDVIIIGKGPAGISAAIYVRMAGFSPIVIGKDYGALEYSNKIGNYYGFPEPIGGRELIERGILQAKNLGIEIIDQEVIDLEQAEYFQATTPQETFLSKIVLLATGKSRSGLKVKGFEELKGKGISFCAVCDGFFYRKKPLAVIGNGDYAASELSKLWDFSNDITLFTNGLPVETLSIPKEIPVVSEPITEILGEGKVAGLLAGGKKYAVDGIFAAVGTASATDFATKLGVFLSGDSVKVDGNYMTNIEGLYSAGDATGGFLQISTAVAEGALAAKSIIKSLKTNKQTNLK